MSARLAPLIGGKAWATIQAHAALVGTVLSVVEGDDPHVIVIDRVGKSHRIDTIDQLEGVLLLIGHAYRQRHPTLIPRDEEGKTDFGRLFTALIAANDLSARMSF